MKWEDKMQKIGAIFLFLASLGVCQAGLIGSFSAAGEKLFTTGGVVDVYFVGADSVFLDDLMYGASVVFNNQTSFPGFIKSLGSFPAGVELVFDLFVADLPQTWSIGPAFRNPDNNVHSVVGLWGSDGLISLDGVYLSWTDLAPGGNYDDLQTVLTGAVIVPTTAGIPEPGTFTLVSAGFIGAGVVQWRRRRRRERSRTS